MKIKLVFYGIFNSNFNGKDYIISQFIDMNSLKVINGTNLEKVESLKQGQEVIVKVEIRRNDLRVIEICS